MSVGARIVSCHSDGNISDLVGTRVTEAVDQ